MPERSRIGLDNQALRGRLRQPAERAVPLRRPGSARDFITDYTVRARPVARPLGQPANPIAVTPDRGRFTAAPAATLKPPAVPQPPPSGPVPFAAGHGNAASRLNPRRYSKPQTGLIGMACLVFVIGLAVSWQTLQINNSAAAQVSALSSQTNKQPTGDSSQIGPVPSTTKPSSQAVSQYVVAPDLARYLKIPRLKVDARVTQVGVTSSGALGTPSNVFDTAWYTGSAKPGQPGATLIDGHVSSWTTPGVFYNIKQLNAGDTMQIVRGDGTILNYQVVKTQVYSADNVDMQAAITPVTAGRPGLNLITCTGHVKKGTSEFNQRVIVFAEQV